MSNFKVIKSFRNMGNKAILFDKNIIELYVANKCIVTSFLRSGVTVEAKGNSEGVTILINNNLY